MTAWPGRRTPGVRPLRGVRSLPRFTPRVARLVARRGGTARPRDAAPLDLQQLELALLRKNVAWHSPLPGGVELAARGYRRVPAGPMRPVVSGRYDNYENVLPILWPQAPVDWGQVLYVAALQIGVDLVYGTAPVSLAPLVAGDQPAIQESRFVILGVQPETPRPYGASFFSLSLYGGWPPAGEVFVIEADLGLQWALARDACAPWAPIAAYAGGCQP